MERFLLSGYTKKNSQGIYEATLEDGQLSDLKLYLPENFPTYLAKHEDALYAISSQDGSGGVAAYKGKMLKNRVLTSGPSLCYVAVDPTRNLVYGSNYHLGEIRVYAITADGLVLTDTVKHEGFGPHPNQTGARVHYSDLTPDGRLVVCDLGTDGVYVYDVAADGKLQLVSQLKMAPGSGPRHLVFHPNGKFAYVLGELDNTITVLDYDAARGAFSFLQKISMLPGNFQDWSAGAAIRITKDGRFLYASNRGHDSIVSYEITEGGKKLTALEWVSSHGHFPRDFNLSQDENYLLIVNQESDNATVYRRDPATGKLTLTQKDFFVPEATCIIHG